MWHRLDLTSSFRTIHFHLRPDRIDPDSPPGDPNLQRIPRVIAYSLPLPPLEAAPGRLPTASECTREPGAPTSGLFRDAARRNPRRVVHRATRQRGLSGPR